MAKNRNRKQTGRKERSAPAGRGQARSTVTAAGSDRATAQEEGTPASHGKRRRFGHN